MINKAILVGHLGRAPEIKRTQSGRRFALLSLATSKRWRAKDSGERRERTDWHRIVVWVDALIDLLAQRCEKGSKLYIEGSFATRRWSAGKDKDGRDITRYTTEIVLNGFGNNLQILDKTGGGGVPDPEDEADYGEESELDHVFA